LFKVSIELLFVSWRKGEEKAVVSVATVTPGAAATQLLAVDAAVIVFATLSLGHVAVAVACSSWS
jgi:hypothetical protein